jgi:hypothetical protein
LILEEASGDRFIKVCQMQVHTPRAGEKIRLPLSLAQCSEGEESSCRAALPALHNLTGLSQLEDAVEQGGYPA